MRYPTSEPLDSGPGISGGGSLARVAQEPAIGLAVQRLSQVVDNASVTAGALRDRLQPLLTPGPEGMGAKADGGNAPRQVRSDVANAIESLADRVLDIERTLAAALSRLEV